MGEHERSSIFATGILWSGIMRTSRGKLFVYVALLGTFLIIMFIFSRTHSNLKELEGVNQKCQQQRDSLSAQLQVVYEHKNRLEKSLQHEKSEHTHTREECDKEHKDIERKQQQDKEKLQSLEKQHSDLKSSYSQLEDDKNNLERKMQDQLQALERQKDEEVQRLRTQLNDLLEEKDELEKSRSDYKTKLQDHMGELNLCRLQYEQMESELNTAKEQVKMLQMPVALGVGPPESLNNAPEEHKSSASPKIHGDIIDVYEKSRNGLANESVHKDKQVLVRPNIQPPDNRKSPGSIASKHYVSDTSVKHGVLIKHSDAPVKMNVDMETDPNKRKSVIQGHESNKILAETNDIGHPDEDHAKLFHQESLNHPQVQPPHNFDDAGEHGEHALFQQNGMDDQKPQLEQPLNNKAHRFSNEILKKSNVIGGYFQPNNGLAVPHLQGFMEKNQEENYVHENHVHPPYEVPHNVNLVKRESHPNDRNANHADGDDDDDDQDGENDEEQLMGGGPAVRGKGFQDRFPDNDFEDNADNENGAKEEEGVVVAPR